MAYCMKCGKQLELQEKFCPACGTPTSTNPDVQEQRTENSAFAGDINRALDAIENTEDETTFFDPNDIAQNKGMSVLAYIGLLVLIPLFSAPKSPFARFHTNQGLVLFVFSIAYNVASELIQAASKLLLPGVVTSLLGGVLDVCGVFFLILMILGIVNAARGQAKKLPLLGKITWIRYK